MLEVQEARAAESCFFYFFYIKMALKEREKARVLVFSIALSMYLRTAVIHVDPRVKRGKCKVNQGERERGCQVKRQ